MRFAVAVTVSSRVAQRLASRDGKNAKGGAHAEVGWGRTRTEDAC